MRTAKDDDMPSDRKYWLRGRLKTDALMNMVEDGICPICRVRPSAHGVTCGDDICRRSWLYFGNIDRGNAD